MSIAAENQRGIFGNECRLRLLKFQKCHGVRAKRALKYVRRRATGDDWEIVGRQHLRRCESECEGQTTRGPVPGVRFEAGAQR